jgi:hypothetical protein
MGLELGADEALLVESHSDLLPVMHKSAAIKTGKK